MHLSGNDASTSPRVLELKKEAKQDPEYLSDQKVEKKLEKEVQLAKDRRSANAGNCPSPRSKLSPSILGGCLTNLHEDKPLDKKTENTQRDDAYGFSILESIKSGLKSLGNFPFLGRSEALSKGESKGKVNTPKYTEFKEDDNLILASSTAFALVGVSVFRVFALSGGPLMPLIDGLLCLVWMHTGVFAFNYNKISLTFNLIELGKELSVAFVNAVGCFKLLAPMSKDHSTVELKGLVAWFKSLSTSCLKEALIFSCGLGVAGTVRLSMGFFPNTFIRIMGVSTPLVAKKFDKYAPKKVIEWEGRLHEKIFGKPELTIK
jgi:hypothetical protein